MEGKVVLNGDEYPISRVVLHIPQVDDFRKMYLLLETGTEAGGFALWDIELSLLENIENLHDKQIHLKPNGETYEDDTLGTDIIGAMTDGNYWSTNSDQYDDFVFGDILIQFQNVENQKYRIHVEMALTESDEDPEDLSPEDYNISASADFEVTIDERNPMEIKSDYI
jgi:hypothetical protein